MKIVRLLSLALITSFIVSMAYAKGAFSQVLPLCPIPYYRLELGGAVYATYFDGQKLWVVYSTAGKSNIALYLLKNNTLRFEWVSSISGKPLAVAIDDKLSLLAIATDTRKVVVYNVKNVPIFYIERGARNKPEFIRFAKLKDNYVLIIIDRTPSGYWVYAYLLNSTKPVSELWLRPPVTSVGANVSYEKMFKVVPVDIVGRYTSLPAVAVVRIVKNVKCQVEEETAASMYGDAVYIDIYTLNWSNYGVLKFTKRTTFRVVPGCEIGSTPYNISEINYAKVYYSPGAKRIYAALGLKMGQKCTGEGCLGREIYAFLLVDSSKNESIVRYRDVAIGVLDYYPLGQLTDASMSAFTATYDNRILFIGSSDYNVRVFKQNTTGDGYYYLWYTLSLAGPVTEIVSSQYAKLVIAIGMNGQMIAFRGDNGDIYWELPALAQASSASIYAGFASIGTSRGTVFAFTKPDMKLYYLGFLFNITGLSDKEKEYVYSSSTLIKIEGVYLKEACRVEISVNKSLEWFVKKQVYFELLPSARYNVIIDNYLLGIFSRSVLLTADVTYPVQLDSFRIPYYKLRLCLIDTWRKAPPVSQDAYLNITRLAGPTLDAPVISALEYPLSPTGCLNITLPRGFYVIKLVSWRYHPQIVFNVSSQVIKLWSNTTLIGNVTPYLAKSVMITVETNYGMPLSNANVTLYDPFSGIRITGFTGAGRLNFTAVPYGNYTVIVTYPYAYPAKAKLNLASPYAALTVTLRPKLYYVTLRVVDAETGAPISPFTYTIVRSFDGFTIASTVMKQNYVILKLAYGVYALSVNAPGYKTGHLDRIVVTNDMLITIRLSPLYYTVVFIVRDEVFQRNLPARLIVFNMDTGKRMILNAPQGVAQVQLRSGNYSVTVDSPYAYQASYKIVITSSKTVLLFVKPRNYTLTVIPIDNELNKPISLLGYNASGYIACSDTGNWTLTWTGKALKAVIPYSRDCVVHLRSAWYEATEVRVPVVDSNITLRALVRPIKYPLVLIVKSTYGIPLSFNATVRGGPLNETIYVKGSGSATIELRPGRYTIIVSALYHQQTYKEVNVTSSGKIVVVLKPRVYPVTLVVIDSETGRQVDRVEVTVMRERPTRSRPFTIIARGGVAVIPLTWGHYVFEIAAEGYRAKSFALDVPKQLNATITLEPLRFPVSIRVYNAIDKRPVVNASIVFMGRKSGVMVKLYTDRKGEAKAELRVDVYNVIVSAPNYQVYTTTLSVKAATSLQVILKPINYTVTFKMYDGLTKSPYTGECSLEISSLTYRNYVVKLKVRGPSAIVQLPYGVYRVTISAPKYQKVSFKLNVNATIPKKAVYLPREVYSVTFKVIDTRGAPVPNAIIRATCLDNRQMTFVGVTGGDGATEAKLPWCRYQVEVEAGGYFPRTIFVDVKANGQTIPIMVRPTLAKIVLDLLPAIIIAGAVIGTGIWVGIRVRRKPAGAELLGEEL